MATTPNLPVNIYGDDIVVMLGDSLTAGNSGVTHPEANPFYWRKFGKALRNYYFAASINLPYCQIPRVYNSGLAGDTIQGNPTTDFANRCGNKNPTVVIVELGTNNSIGSMGAGPYQAAVDALLALLVTGTNYRSKVAPREILWVLPEYNAVSRADVMVGNEVIRARCALNNVQVLDIIPAWEAAGHAVPDAGEMTWDTRHLTALGSDFESDLLYNVGVILHPERKIAG